MGSGCSNSQSTRIEDSNASHSSFGRKSTSKLGTLQSSPYTEVYSKYQLSRQRWTTVRAFQKLDPQIMKNFSKVIQIDLKENNHMEEIKLASGSKDEQSTSPVANDDTDNKKEGNLDLGKRILKKFLTIDSKNSQDPPKSNGASPKAKKKRNLTVFKKTDKVPQPQSDKMLLIDEEDNSPNE